MDLNPTFGELLETLSQNSGSTKNSKRNTKQQLNSTSSPGSQAGDSQTTPAGDGGVDEAVRRLGYRLSLQAHGLDISTSSSAATREVRENSACKPLQISLQSDFLAFNKKEAEAASRNVAGVVTESETEDEARTNKVAKTRYSDHGEHHQKPSSLGSNLPGRCLVRKLTYECKDRFLQWEQQQQEFRRRHEQIQRPQQGTGKSDYSQQQQQQSSPHRYAFSQLKLDSSSSTSMAAPETVDKSSSPSRQQNRYSGSYHNRHQQQQQPQDSSMSLSFDQDGHSGGDAKWNHPPQQLSHHQHHHRGSRNMPGSMGSLMGGGHHHHSSNKGLLSAVLESDTSATSTSAERRRNVSDGGASLGSQSMNTDNGSKTAVSSLGATLSQNSASAPPRGKCLTTPAHGVANGGLDNVEGNFIVYENDSIVVPRKNVRTIRKEVEEASGAGRHLRSAEFRIQALQGQGTFAQVFQCLEVQTGQQVALKIIKNKPAYTRQAAIEIDIFQTLQDSDSATSQPGTTPRKGSPDYMVNLLSYFMHQNHLCLVFELLGLNLYEVLKRRQFRGLPLTMVRDVVRQAVEGIRDLSQRNVVHCDIKPENILLLSQDVDRKVVGAGDNGSRRSNNSASDLGTKSEDGGVDASEAGSSKGDSAASSGATVQAKNLEVQATPSCKIKLIDFGSACFEGYTAHTYIQSRFYRSPEVLLGLPYDSAIDVWSLGCVAAELFLGLPILPGVHEHDQLGRIMEMISKVPDWMLDQGAKSTKYYAKFVSRPHSEQQSPLSETDSHTPSSSGNHAPVLPQWRIKTQSEYIASLSQSEISKKGGLEKLMKQPGSRYFKRKKLCDILILHAQNTTGRDRDLVPAFVHFLYGVLDPDPWKRLTAFQAAQHPFVTGDLNELRPRNRELKLDPAEENQANLELDVYWKSPWDPSICRRKLLNVQKMREKQAMRRGQSGRSIDAYSQGSDRRRNRRDDSSSKIDLPAHLSQENPALNRKSDASSPPNQISSSGSTNAGPASGNGGEGHGSSTSWTGHGQPEINSQLVTDNVSFGGQGARPANPTLLSTAQSFQGAGYTPTEADFALALQRPGVVPGRTDGFGTSVTSQSTSASSFLPNNLHPFQNQAYSNEQFMQSSSFGLTSPQTLPGLGVSTTNGASGPGQDFFVNTQGQNVMMRPPSPAPSMMSTASSLTMPDSTFIDPQHFALMQQQQQMALLQQQQQQLGMLQQAWPQQTLQQQALQQQQPPQQAGLQPGLQQQSLFQQPQVLQQQPQLALQQQQPVFLAEAPGGGYYYVTTSATGQPVLLQPLGLLNQAAVQPMLNNQQTVQQGSFVQPGQAFAPQMQSQQIPQQQGGGVFLNQGVMDTTNQQPGQQAQQPQSPQRQFQPAPARENQRFQRRGGTSM